MVRTTQTNYTDIGDGVILQREIVVNSGSDSGSGAKSSEIEQSSSVWTEYVAPIILAVLIALVLLLLAILACCWWKGYFG